MTRRKREKEGQRKEKRGGPGERREQSEETRETRERAKRSRGRSRSRAQRDQNGEKAERDGESGERQRLAAPKAAREPRERLKELSSTNTNTHAPRAAYVWHRLCGSVWCCGLAKLNEPHPMHYGQTDPGLKIGRPVSASNEYEAHTAPAKKGERRGAKLPGIQNGGAENRG